MSYRIFHNQHKTNEIMDELGDFDDLLKAYNNSELSPIPNFDPDSIFRVSGNMLAFEFRRKAGYYLNRIHFSQLFSIELNELGEVSFDQVADKYNESIGIIEDSLGYYGNDYQVVITYFDVDAENEEITLHVTIGEYTETLDSEIPEMPLDLPVECWDYQASLDRDVIIENTLYYNSEEMEFNCDYEFIANPFYYVFTGTYDGQNDLSIADPYDMYASYIWFCNCENESRWPPLTTDDPYLFFISRYYTVSNLAKSYFGLDTEMELKEFLLDIDQPPVDYCNPYGNPGQSMTHKLFFKWGVSICENDLPN